MNGQNNNIHTSFDSESSAVSFFFPPPNCTHRNDAQLPHTITILKAWEWWGLEYTSKVTLYELFSMMLYLYSWQWRSTGLDQQTQPFIPTLVLPDQSTWTICICRGSILISSTFVYNTYTYIMLQEWRWIINGWTFLPIFCLPDYFSVWLQWKSLKNYLPVHISSYHTVFL